MAALLSEITGLHPVIEDMRSKMRRRIEDQEKARTRQELNRSGEYWTLVAYADALTRIRLIIEQNFHFIETLGVLAVTRYMFELLVWLRVLRHDERYGLVYFFQVIEKQIKYYEDYAGNIKREIAFLEQLGTEERTHLEAEVRTILATNDEDSMADAVEKARTAIKAETDRKARRHFCLFADQAKTNGHSFQADLMRNQILPKLDQRLDELRRERNDFLAAVKGKPPIGSKWDELEKNWRWKKQSELVGMSDQFEFIYSFTSRLLHATPVSMTTDQKLLEPHEMRTFLDYVCISILDVVELTKGLLEVGVHKETVH